MENEFRLYPSLAVFLVLGLSDFALVLAFLGSFPLIPLRKLVLDGRSFKFQFPAPQAIFGEPDTLGWCHKFVAGLSEQILRKTI